MTEVFTLEEFKKALPVNKNTGEPLAKSLGFRDGEEVFEMVIDDYSAISIRSSIKGDGKAAATGKDSIRAWLVTREGKPLGSKVSKWTTRLPGWEGRLTEVLRTLWGWRKAAGNCSCCGEPKRIYKVKAATENKGRVFANCENKCQGQWIWLT